MFRKALGSLIFLANIRAYQGRRKEDSLRKRGMLFISPPAAKP
jgi:hypothetical protein